MGKKVKTVYNGFKSNGYAKTYTPKAGTTKASDHLKRIKAGVKQEKRER